MATNSNADEYANARQNIWFTANNQTPADGNLTGQCVTLEKWFLNDMTGVPGPFLARGHGKDVGRTLVNQGHAIEVPFAQRRRGDIISYEYGTYGHVAIQLSGGRVFESNVNWSGVQSKIVDGERVYASRIGLENEAWRVGKNPHVYRVKTYNEGGGNSDVIGKDDVGPVRVVMSEVEGWPMNEIHAGVYDSTIMGAWQGHTWQEFIMHCWNVNPNHRGYLVQQIAELNTQIANLSKRPTQEQLDALNKTMADLQKAADEAEKAQAESQAKYEKLAEENATADKETKGFLRALWRFITGRDA